MDIIEIRKSEVLNRILRDEPEGKWARGCQTYALNLLTIRNEDFLMPSDGEELRRLLLQGHRNWTDYGRDGGIAARRHADEIEVVLGGDAGDEEASMVRQALALDIGFRIVREAVEGITAEKEGAFRHKAA